MSVNYSAAFKSCIKARNVTLDLTAISMRKKEKRLVELPLKKSVEIAFHGIHARFFRSLITTSTLILAVAFLCYSLVGADVAKGLLATGDSALYQDLIRSGYDVLPDGSSLKASPKQRWIVILSLLVCIVGIINAQLMSVTERFREIGTMKCLGALDRFVVRIFILEAFMQGLAGSLIGVMFGTSAAIANALLQFGTASFLPYMGKGLLNSILIATSTGLILSLLGVLYPAFLAARMQPVEAMRVEQ